MNSPSHDSELLSDRGIKNDYSINLMLRTKKKQPEVQQEEPEPGLQPATPIRLQPVTPLIIRIPGVEPPEGPEIDRAVEFHRRQWYMDK